MKNRTFGSVFIVAGTTIGAGMLAMPLATMGVGFFTSMIILIGLWGLTNYTALLLVEVYQYSTSNIGFGTLVSKYLGHSGKIVAGGSMIFLMYALIAAYISGAGELLVSNLNKWLNLSFPISLGSVLFTLITGCIVCVGTNAVDFINRIVFSIKFIFFILMLAMITPHIDHVNLLSMPIGQGIIISSIPVIFTSFGFHGCVPSIVRYMNGDIKKLRRIFIIGSSIPLISYIMWQLAMLGSLESRVLSGILIEKSGLEGLLRSIHDVVISPESEFFIQMFANLALITSFLGVALGLFDFLADLFKRHDSISGRLQTGFLTFLPPLSFSCFYPNGFVIALSYAAVALSILALLLPSLLAFKARKKNTGQYRVIGGTPMLVSVFLLGIFIIFIQLGVMVGIFPEIGGASENRI
ncbi:Tyrosine-specific transport protein [Xenorhabdus poinarii G6]|uniref:Aromatic amino acid permease n=1 Tax=Xenorhabdus poinarii G6 TaxID=1354304 RepID=A0A068R3V7_9GAMM|nr:tyrosine transporter TyrP [Xenorhabdus poinarii]CDG21606.1 Tyrosine-specific transport protein [Xenorhabdus poinarii G6]